MDKETGILLKKISGTAAFCLFFVLICTGIIVFLPADKPAEPETQLISTETGISRDQVINYDELFQEEYPELVMDTTKKTDPGLAMYKQPQSRAAVEWYYSRVTNNREVTQAILKAAEEYNIPLSLAFALAHTESRFKVTAIHKNTNGSVDRGLFQLNNTSFPKLEEADFYNPEVSAHYGLSHLRFCLNTAGNEIAALAMYNAGANKVRKNNTPQITLNYISQIQTFKTALEDNFAEEVMAYYGTESLNKLLAKK